MSKPKVDLEILDAKIDGESTRIMKESEFQLLLRFINAVIAEGIDPSLWIDPDEVEVFEKIMSWID